MQPPGHDWYVLFPNHHQGLRLHRVLREAGVECTVAPTPRVASASCGISLLIQEADLTLVSRLAAEHGIEVSGTVKVARTAHWQYRGC